MEKNYWLSKWQTNDIAFHEAEINPHLIRYFPSLHLKKGASIFVPLCGKSKDMLWLAEQGFHVLGSELSPIACQDFFAELKITPTITQQAKWIKYQYKTIELFCGDLFDLSTADLPHVEAVYDCKALIALPSEIRKKYVQHLTDCLGQNIKILLLTRETNCPVQPPPFPIDHTEVNALYSPYFTIEQLEHTTIQNIPERLIKKGLTQMTENVYKIF